MVWNERVPNKPEGCTMSRLQYHCEQKMDSVSMTKRDMGFHSGNNSNQNKSKCCLVTDNVQN